VLGPKIISQTQTFLPFPWSSKMLRYGFIARSTAPTLLNKTHNGNVSTEEQSQHRKTYEEIVFFHFRSPVDPALLPPKAKLFANGPYVSKDSKQCVQSVPRFFVRSDPEYS
jgi:hypothetical protein